MPAVAFAPGRHKRARGGCPWVYSNEVVMDAAARALAPGSLVRLTYGAGETLGLAVFNPRTLIAARLLARDPAAVIDAGFIAARLERALALRELLYPGGYYRLIHAEADGLPGLIIDRFGPAVVIQANTAGMDRLLAEILEAVEAVLGPETIVLRNDAPARTLEGLGTEVRVAKGSLDGAVTLEEGGARFRADLVGGQKTGWFYDQRDNRAMVARLAPGRRVLDLYAYGGGFAALAARAGAESVLAIDRSEAALALAAEAAVLNGVESRCRFVRAEAFAELARLAAAGERFDIVVADPPAFVPSRKDLAVGLRGYRKLARLSAALVAPGGFLFIASCSHNVEPAALAEEVRRALADLGRSGRILAATGAALDHPVHPALPETAYLKALLLQLD